jgi:serine O-acetyltransferase
MEKFVSFLLQRVYESKPIPNEFIEIALKNTIDDVKYHFPDVTNKEIIQSIQVNSNELVMFLFRLGSELQRFKLKPLLSQIHWLLKELCACEIYFNNIIGVGFYVVHGEGLIIGSRNKIGKGFVIHQGCTIGHKRNGIGRGVVIKNNVKVYCNSSILGDLEIGENSIIGAHVLVTSNVLMDSIVINKLKMKTKSINKKE